LNYFREADMDQNSITATAKVAVITGGLGALGQAVVAACVAAGYRVAIVDQAPPDSPAAAAVSGKPDILLSAGTDLGNAAATAAAMQAASDRFGRIDVLINIAGGFRWQLLGDGDLATWDWLYGANLRSAVTACRAALPFMKRNSSGRIINIGAAAAAARSAAGMGAYAASKAGVHKLTESLAEELKDVGITVNAILPGVIDTPQNRADMPDADVSRWVGPQDIASVILFLASDQAQAVTGALLPVYGRG
jgi:NAD(P)-dependent dehydrogenase (short-subunit alcohol dehydrogenase family)